MNAASFGFFAAAAVRQRMIGRDRHELRAEQRVRPRGEDLELALAVRAWSPDRARSGPAGPRERPIQFFCISRTFSGQRSSVSSASSRSSRIVA